MAKQGLIRPHIKDAAHEIRLLGNNMAHGDFVDRVEPEGADEILELMARSLPRSSVASEDREAPTGS
jgi:hypothetical protein